MRWFLPFAALYVLWLALIANSAWELAYGDTAFGVPSLCLVLLLLGWTLWRNRQWNRSTESAARAAVERVLTERAGTGGGKWLDRDGHMRMAAARRGHLFWAVWDLGRIDETQFDQISVHGRAPVTIERYQFARICPRVPRFTVSAMVTAGGDIDYLPAAEPGLMWMVRMTGLAGKGKNTHAFADTAELAELAEQIRAAVPIA